MGIISQGNVELIKRILRDYPSIVNDYLPSGCTPLFASAVFGKEDITAILLEAGADANLTEMDEGYTPLMVASRKYLIYL